MYSVRQFEKLRTEGLLTITSRSDPENAITLCPTCYTNFDDYSSSGFIVVSTRLEYFQSFEDKDFESRKKDWEEFRIRRPRRMPLASEYRRYCATLMEQDMEEEDLSGGLYIRYMLRDFYPEGLVKGGANPYPKPKAWAGDPYTTIRRATRAIGTCLDGVPREVIDNLRKLQDLYYYNKLPGDTAQSENDPGSSRATSL